MQRNLTNLSRSRKSAIEGLHEAISNELDPSWNIKINLLVIGAFATEAISNMPVLPGNSLYENTPVGNMRKLFANTTSDQSASDGPKINFGTPPSTAAKVILDIADNADTPLRVPVGVDAAGMMKGKVKDNEESIKYAEKWEKLFPSASA
jgi:hypothetical protein